MRGLRIVIGSVAVASALTLAGCATSGGDAGAAGPELPDPDQSEVATPVAGSTPSRTTDAQTCAAIGDIVSITFNVDVAVSEGRMSTQERDGWYRLATSVLARVPTSGGGLVSETVAALQTVVPPVALSGMGRGESGSDEWDQQWSAVFQSCADAGSEIATVAFTGG